MIQPIENKKFSIEEILVIFRSQAESLPSSPTSSRYLRALESLESSVLSSASLRADAAAHGAYAPYSEADLSQVRQNPSVIVDPLSVKLTDWLVSQWLLGQPFSTASLYLDIISALYGSAVKAGQLPPTETFTRLKTDLKTLGPDGWKKGIDDEIFSRALRLTKNAAHLIAEDAIAADIVLISLTQNLLPLEDVALLKREDLDEVREKEIHEIVDRHLNSNGRRKYVFPLRQAERTPKQLSRLISRIVNALFKRARLPQSTDPFQTVEALWAYAALRTGVPASIIIRHLGHAPLGLPVLKLCNISILREADAPINNSSLVIDNLSLIGKVFLDNPPRWYAMSLRPGVRFTQVCRRIQLLSKPHTAQRAQTEPSAPILRAPLADTPFSSLQLFYPCEEIARAIGKKIVTKQRPFIHSVVFFKAKLTDIGPLFAKIGDLAWCYRQSARPGAPYAEITQRQFQLFQQTIAQFTPDYEVASTGELKLKKNDRVEIVGGLFAGHEATFDSIAHETESAPTVYRLNIIGDNGIEWRISVDSRIAK